MIDFIKKIITHKSIEADLESIHSCIDFFTQKFEPFFAHRKRFQFRDKPIEVLSTHDTFEFDVIISGHIDVVPGSDLLFSPQETDGQLRGRGAYDMKAPLAAMSFGVLDYLKENSNDNLKIALIITADEEIDGLSVRHVAKTLGYSADLAIIPDAGSIDQLVVDQKGFWQFKVDISSASAHASHPWETINPFEVLHEIHGQIQKAFPNPKTQEDWVTSVSLTKVIGGDAVNAIPEKIEAYFDVRFIDDFKKELIYKILKNNSNSRYQIDYADVAYNSALHVNLEKNNYAQTLLSSMETYLDKEIILSRTPSTSDAIFFVEAGTPTVLFRPIGGDIHTDNEWVNIESLHDMRKIAKHFLENIKKDPNK